MDENHGQLLGIYDDLPHTNQPTVAVNKKFTFRLRCTIVLRCVRSTKNGERTESETGARKFGESAFFAVMADHLWNAAVTREDTVATGYLPTPAGR